MSMDDPQSGREAHRLIKHMQVDLPVLEVRERMQLDLMGGPFPEKKNDFHDYSRVLDINCGVGSWALEVARANPGVNVIGLAALPELVEAARKRAETAGLKNAHFLLNANPEETRLPFADAEFDLVNAQYLHIWLRTGEWASFLKDCWRVTRTGGSLRVTEPERGQTTSLAVERLLDLYLQALHQSGQRFSPDDRHIGAASQLPYVFQETGWCGITRRAYMMEQSALDNQPKTSFTHLNYYIQTFQPPILQAGLASAEELTTLLQQIAEDIENEDFTAQRFLITVCGHKAKVEQEEAKAPPTRAHQAAARLAEDTNPGRESHKSAEGRKAPG